MVNIINSTLPLNPVVFLFAVKPEVSTVVYKAGECMQELIKLWKEFEASEDYKSNARNGPTLEIRIPAEYVTATNRQVSLFLLLVF